MQGLPGCLVLHKGASCPCRRQILRFWREVGGYPFAFKLTDQLLSLSAVLSLEGQGLSISSFRVPRHLQATRRAGWQEAITEMCGDAFAVSAGFYVRVYIYIHTHTHTHTYTSKGTNTYDIYIFACPRRSF